MDPNTPPVRPVRQRDLDAFLAHAPVLAILDDDPTGTQTVSGLPVLTRWRVDDVRWALSQGTPGFFVLTNTRSLDPREAAQRTATVADACLQAARLERRPVTFASRSDSTLRGHFPLETDTLASRLAAAADPVDAVVLVPAFPEAGRVTVGGTHWVRTADGLVPVADTDFARDATFGYRSSRLADWVEEKSRGRIPAADVVTVPLEIVREDPQRLAAALAAAAGGRVVACDAADAQDVRALALAALQAEAGGRRLLYRVGPSFAGPRTGRDAGTLLDDDHLTRLTSRSGHGLVIVGSHVPLSTRQLRRLLARRDMPVVELDVASVLDEAAAPAHLKEAAARLVAALVAGPAVLSTSRERVSGPDAAGSLAVARTVSSALTRVVAHVATGARLSYVVAKGGITASDVATGALGIRRAWVRGSLLPGLVSLWEAAEGPAAGLPYVVVAGNVGDDEALADVVDRLEGP